MRIAQITQHNFYDIRGIQQSTQKPQIFTTEPQEPIKQVSFCGSSQSLRQNIFLTSILIGASLAGMFAGRDFGKEATRKTYSLNIPEMLQEGKTKLVHLNNLADISETNSVINSKTVRETLNSTSNYLNDLITIESNGNTNRYRQLYQDTFNYATNAVKKAH